MITKSILKKDLEKVKKAMIRLFILGFVVLATLIGGLYFI